MSATISGMSPALRKDRLERGLSQAAYAEFLGYHRLTVVRWETGKRKPSPRELKQISKKTGIPAPKLRPDLAALLGRD